MSDLVGIIVVNYNMPERTDAICDHLGEYVQSPYKLVVVDNGSDIAPPSRYTNLKLDHNQQTTRGWLAGLEFLKQEKSVFAYWFIITSAAFPPKSGDVLTPMLQFLVDDPNAVGIHPSLTEESTTSWGQLYNRYTNSVRRTWMIDNIASLYRARWFDSIGWFDPRMKYAWGIDLETCYRARRQGRSLWIDDRVQVEKVTNIGYAMNRMGMTAEERGQLAHANMVAELGRKYGPNWWERMTKEGVEDDWR